MDRISFFKMSGSGNDFILVDNREKSLDDTDLPGFIPKICARKMSVGADGFILIENSASVDFKWRFFNSDGSLAEMCGNGARCAARFAFLNGVAGRNMSFETDVGLVEAVISDSGVKIKMPEPRDINLDILLELEKGPLSVSCVNTGVPHAVLVVDKLDRVDVVEQGRQIRYHKNFAPAGTNVNYISSRQDGTIDIRTYERGVEDETLACGTGSVAGAIIMACKEKVSSPVSMRTKSGAILKIFFTENDGGFYDIFLEGDARVIYQGQLWNDAWQY